MAKCEKVNEDGENMLLIAAPPSLLPFISHLQSFPPFVVLPAFLCFKDCCTRTFVFFLCYGSAETYRSPLCAAPLIPPRFTQAGLICKYVDTET